VATPILVVVAGPNGAGTTTLYERVLARVMHLEFVNADRIAAARWPGDQGAHAYDAARLAQQRRGELLEARSSFITETVFSHPSKLELMAAARSLDYRVQLHVVVIPEALAVARVANRVEVGGHDVPEHKVRERHGRLWGHLRRALAMADDAWVYDNSSAATPLRLVARYVQGELAGTPTWPTWVPAEFTALTRG
jgi:predicted ABC-type ATPase